MCGALLKELPTSPGIPTTSLRTAIETTFADVDSAILQRACERFRSRMEAVIEADLGYIE